MPTNTHTKRVATAYAEAASIPYQRALEGVRSLAARGYPVSDRDEVSLRATLALLAVFADAAPPEAPAAAGGALTVRGTLTHDTTHPVPSEGEVLVGRVGSGAEVRLRLSDSPWGPERIGRRWWPGVLVAGRPGAGRTSVLLGIARDLAPTHPLLYLDLDPLRDVSPDLAALGASTLTLDGDFLRAHPGVLDPIRNLGLESGFEVLREALLAALGWSSSNYHDATRIERFSLRFARIVSDRREDDSLGRTSASVLADLEPEVRDHFTKAAEASPAWRSILGEAGSGEGLLLDRVDGRTALVRVGAHATTSVSRDVEALSETLLAITASFPARVGGGLVVDGADELVAARWPARSALDRVISERRSGDAVVVLGTSSVPSRRETDSLFDRALLLGDLGEGAGRACDLIGTTPSAEVTEALGRTRGPREGLYLDRINDWWGEVATRGAEAP